MSKKTNNNPDAMPLEGSLGALPSRLSPSRLNDYIKCPKYFYFTTILKIRTPGSFATFKGTLAHYAFEHIFNHPSGERTVENALPYVDAAWAVITNPFIEYDEIEADSAEALLRDDLKAWKPLHAQENSDTLKLKSDQEEARLIIDDPDLLIKEAKEVVTSWFNMEKPYKFDPYGREVHVEAELGDVTLHGFIDRLDKIVMPNGEVRYYISDYKTGKKPNPRYEEKAFFQLDIYAALVKEIFGQTPFQLRLIYVKEGNKDAILKRTVTDGRVERTKAKANALWKDIQESAKKEEWIPRKQVLCDWCYFKDVCPAWNPELDGILAEEINLRLKESQ